MFAKKTGMDFGRALALLKAGKRVSREAWNGKSISIVFGKFEPAWSGSYDDIIADDWQLLDDAAIEKEEAENTQEAGEVRLTVHVSNSQSGDRAKQLLKEYHHLGGEIDIEQDRINLHYRVSDAVAPELATKLGNMGYHTTISGV